VAWSAAIKEIADRLKMAPKGSVAIIASARQTNEELYLIKKLATHLGAITDSIPRLGKRDQILVNEDKNPNTHGARLNGICFTEVGINLSKIAAGVQDGSIRTLLVFGEDILKRSVGTQQLRDQEITSELVDKHGLDLEAIGKLDTVVVSDILPNQTTPHAHYLLPGCAHVEKRGTFTNAKGRVQKFVKALEPPGDARPEWEVLAELLEAVTGRKSEFKTIEGLFNAMAREVHAFRGLTWAGLGDTGVTIEI
jgi:NADH-quinone oxidoreductase subunit G